MKPPDLPTRGTKSRPGEADGLESCTGTQAARIHAQDVGYKSNEPANTSVTPDLPANGAEPCIGEPNRLERKTDMSDVCTCTQSVADESIMPTDNLESVRKS